MKMNLTAKMIAYFLLVVVVAAVGFAYTIWQVDNVTNENIALKERTIPMLLRTNNVTYNAMAQVSFLRGWFITGDSQMLAAWKRVSDAATAREEELINNAVGEKSRKISGETKALDDKYTELAEKKFVPLVQAGKRDEAMKVMVEELGPAAQALNAKLEEHTQFRVEQINEALEATVADARQARTAAIGAAIFAAVLGVAIGFFAARSIAQPVNQLAAVARKVADGDLTDHVRVDRQDEIGQLATAFNDMVDHLKSLIKQINVNAEQLAASSQELTASAEQSAQAANQVATSITGVANGATEQLAAANETSAVVEQMSAGIQQVAANTNQVAEQSAQTADKAKKGGEAVDKAVVQMYAIEKSAQVVAETIGTLNAKSNDIGQIVDTISGIAGQTNLLALNAAIEAARAGEQGRGFAVVAEEVRKLAEESQEAAKRIAAMIGEIQGDTAKAVKVMNDGAHEVKSGAEIVNAAGVAFAEIVEMVSQVSGRVSDISAVIQQMAGGSQQIVGSVKKIDSLSKASAGEAQSVSAATEEQLASMEEIAASSEALAKLAQELQSAVARFHM